MSKTVDVGIPTEYRGVRFRSRLEAKWAVFMDAIDWRWEYEPYDMAGYIPDFLILSSSPFLVEVKPVSRYEEAERIAQCVPLPDGAEHVVLVVGVTPFLTGTCYQDVAGAITQWFGECEDEAGTHAVAPAEWSGDSEAHSFAVVHSYGAWIPYPAQGRHKPGISHEQVAELQTAWACATNLAQWRAA